MNTSARRRRASRYAKWEGDDIYSYARRRRASRYAKWEGDDIYSYALFVNGRAVYTGMSKSEAKWRRDRYVETGEL